MVHKSEKLLGVKEAITNLLLFLIDYLPLANAHSTDFILLNLWNEFFPENIKNELCEMSDEQLGEILSPSCSTGISAKHGVGDNSSQHSEVTNTKTNTSNKLLMVSEKIRNSSYIQKAPGVENVKKLNKVRHIPPNWQHSSVESYVNDAKQQVLNELNVLTPLTEIIPGSSHCGDDVFVAKFMSEKKSHEVEILADLCNKLVKDRNVGLVIDVGSGKGYLGSYLSLHYNLPVIGVDSSDNNTSSAGTRADKLKVQWNSLVKNAKAEKLAGKKIKMRMKNRRMKNAGKKKIDANSEKDSSNWPSDTEEYISDSLFLLELNTENALEDIEKSYSQTDVQIPSHDSDIFTISSNYTSPEEKCHNCSRNVVLLKKERQNNHKTDDLKSKFEDSPCSDHSCSKCEMNEFSGKEAFSHSKETDDSAEKESRNTYSQNAMCNTQEKEKYSLNVKTEHRQITDEKTSKHISITQFINSSSDLDDIVLDNLDHLGVHNVGNLKLMLTGLHTCGALGSSVLKLFVDNPQVTVLCNVACCYHLMTEQFSRNNHQKDDEPHPTDTDFPMSSFLRKEKIVVGMNARNLASQSIHRMRSELLGKSCFPRTLLQVIINDVLGYVSDDWKGLRRLKQKTTDLYAYISKAFEKLGLPKEKISKELVDDYQERYKEDEKRLAAFYQMKAVLAPAIESLVLLDRLCYLLEQEVVEDAHLVKLFNPVTSPRCYGIIATKIEKES